jgi:hypothetical protein
MALIAGSLLVMGAFGQSYSSFTSADIVGVNLSSQGLAYTASIDQGAYFIQGGITYQVTHVMGFWVLDKTHSLNAWGYDDNGWSWNQNTGDGGDIAGWTNLDHAGRLSPPPGAPNMVTCDFTSINENAITERGFHLEWMDANGVISTGHVKGPYTPVPEPSEILTILTGLGLVVMGRIRRR